MKFRVALLSGVVFFLLVGSQLASAQDHAQHYVLDAYGGVHAGGGAPIVSPASPYFGFDVAANIEYVPVGTSTAVGDGYIVLDKFGGVHYGGALAADPPSGTPTPYFGFDAARSIVLRKIAPRMNGAVSATNPFIDVTDTTFQSLVSTTVIAPTDGFLLVTGTASMQCGNSVGFTRAAFSTNVDSTAGDPRILSGAGYSDELPCGDIAMHQPTGSHSVQLIYPVTAGSHTAHLVYKWGGGNGGFFVLHPSITAIFFDGS